MPLSPGFIDYALDLVGGLGGVQARRMFGGAGLYLDGVMFALLDQDVLYFRVDAALEADLRAQGSAPWRYSINKDGRVREMGYWRIPDAAADDPERAVALAGRALAAARERKVRRAPSPRGRASRPGTVQTSAPRSRAGRSSAP